MTAQDYFAQMCKDAGLDDTTTSALTALANNEKLSPKFNSLVKRATEDFDAQTGRVKAAEEKVKRYDDWYPTAKSAADTAIARATAVEEELANLRKGGDPAGFDASKYLTKEDLQRYSVESSQRFAGVLKDATRITARHVARFNEEPDLDAIDALAAKENLPLSAAYDRWIQPRVEEANKVKFEKEKKDFADQAVKDALSRQGGRFPVDPTGTGSSSPIFTTRDPKAAPPDMDAELVSTWNGAQNGTTKY